MIYAPIAQLDRVTGYEPVGRGFESLLACQVFKRLINILFISLLNTSNPVWIALKAIHFASQNHGIGQVVRSGGRCLSVGEADSALFLARFYVSIIRKNSLVEGVLFFHQCNLGSST